MSIFSAIRSAPLDPVVVSLEAFAADPRPTRINLGVGMYYDETGRIPLLESVREGGRRVRQGVSEPWSYIPVEGLPGFRREVGRLILGEEHAAVADRLVTFQSIGGTGALATGAQLLKQLVPEAVVAVSDPSWPNHYSLFGEAGFEIVPYPYYDSDRAEVDFAAASAAIERLPRGSIVVLQGCCHNPTGADFSPDQWEALAGILAARGLIPFVDLAYQGFGEGIEADAAPVRLLVAKGLPVFAAVSFSKSFALYGERVGALLIVADDADQAARLTDQIKNVVRALYSTAPTHGAAIVAEILGDPALEALWRQELDGMRLRIQAVRRGLVERLASNHGPDFGCIARQRGLFSFSGLDAGQVARLQAEFGIYALSNGRLCMTALNDGNLSTVADAIRTVIADVSAPRRASA
jgi:aromatic-amino-acid transaminase